LGGKYFHIIKESPENAELVSRQLRKIRRIVGAYQLLNDPESINQYMHTIRIRSMLNQQPICYKDETKGSYYPYMLFSISEKDTILMLEIDFVKETITFHQKDHDMKEYGFSQIKNVLQGREHDQLMIEFNFGKKN